MSSDSSSSSSYYSNSSESENSHFKRGAYRQQAKLNAHKNSEDQHVNSKSSQKPAATLGNAAAFEGQRKILQEEAESRMIDAASRKRVEEEIERRINLELERRRGEIEAEIEKRVELMKEQIEEDVKVFFLK